MSADPTVTLEKAKVRLPTRYGLFSIRVYPDPEDFSKEHVALFHGDVESAEPSLVRVHSECLTGDVFGSKRCDCGPQLDEALRRIAAEPRGVLVYLRQEGRGIGLGNKMRAYALQDCGRDTVEANLELGFPDDLRDYQVAADMLGDLGVKSVRLLTNNPKKVAALEEAGIHVVDRVPIVVGVNPENEAYLDTKREKLGHLLKL
ncbi:MAG: GTP cyclohydrolase II [Acidobacteriota bacterium]